MNSAKIITTTEKSTLFLLARNQIKVFLIESLEKRYNLHVCASETDMASLLTSSEPKLIVFHSDEYDLSGDSFNHIPKIWITIDKLISDQELISCYEKGIECISGPEISNELINAKINGILQRQQLNEHYVRKKLLFGENIIQTRNEDKQFIEKIHEYLATSSSKQEFSIEKMSQDLAMSRTNFFSKVKSITGVSPSKMVMNYRLTNAIVLLNESDGNITDVAYKVGFSSTAYFTKCFKEKYGKKPSEVRKV